jgi:hypothetical protein
MQNWMVCEASFRMAGFYGNLRGVGNHYRLLRIDYFDFLAGLGSDIGIFAFTSCCRGEARP